LSETTMLVMDAIENETREKIIPMWFAMNLVSSITKIPVPPLEEFINIEQPRNQRTAEEIEADFDKIVQKVRETDG